MIEPDRMPIVITKLFARLQGIYGTAFTSKFSTGLNAETNRDDGWENAKTVWAEDLAGFELDDIAYALRHVDPDRAPSSRQFVELCRKAPRKQTTLALPAPSPVDADRAKALAARVAKVFEGKIEGGIDRHWATHPKCPRQFRMILDAVANDARFRQCVDEMVEQGICTGDGRLLKYFKGGQWYRYGSAA